VNLAILYLYLQFSEKQLEDIDDDLDYRALESGFVSWRIKFIFKHVFHWAVTIYAVKFIYFLWMNRLQLLLSLYLLILRPIFKWQLLIGFHLCFLVNNSLKQSSASAWLCTFEISDSFLFSSWKQRWSRSVCHTHSIVDIINLYSMFVCVCKIFCIPLFIVSFLLVASYFWCYLLPVIS